MNRPLISGITGVAVVLISLIIPEFLFAGGDPANRLDFSRVRTRSLDGTVKSSTSLASLGQPVVLSAAAQEVLEIEFIGAPRWLNHVVFRTDAAVYRIEVCGVDRERTWSEFGGKLRQVDDAVVLSGADTFARGIRFRPLATASGDGSVIVEMRDASFRQADPDDGPIGDVLPLAEEGTKECHVGWSNEYPGTANDLTCADYDAEQLNNDLPNDWTKWIHSDLNNHEVHYKSTAVGNGDNNDHVDAADLGFYVGHGVIGAFFIGNDDEDDDYLLSSDATLTWGNNDLEFMGAPACQWLDSSSRALWHDAMDGLHLICGSETIARSTYLYSYGGKWASKMKDSGWADAAQTVKTAWFDTYEAENPAGNVAVVIGETSTQLDDYLWGEGTVSSEPVHDDYYSSVRYSAGGLRPSRLDPRGDGLERRAPVATDPVLFTPDGGVPVTIDQSLLSSPAVQLPYYVVQPAMVDSPFVRALAQEICATEGVLCGGDIGPGDEDEINLIDGLVELRVCLQTGSFTYEDHAEWLRWRMQAPELPSPATAEQLANLKLNQWGRRPPDAFFHSARYVRQARVSHPQGEEVEDPQLSFPNAIQAIFQRRLGMQEIPVEGGGGYMSVTFGDDNQLQRVFRPGWHPVTPGAPVTIIPVQDVVQAIAARGTGATVDAISPPAQSITINGWHLAYYETSCGVPQQRLRPIYVFDAVVLDPLGNNVPTVIYAWADELNPVVDIVTPPGPIAMPFGTSVCADGTWAGGTPPVTLTWKDDQGNVLGTGMHVCFPVTMPPVGNHSEDDSTRTVTLIARDALGSIAQDIVSIRVMPGVAAVGPVDAASSLLSPSLPNPFREATRITFRVPELSPGDEATLRIFDVTGRLVATLASGRLSPGEHEVTWAAKDAGGHRVGPGMYFCEFRAGSRVATQKLLVIQ